MNKLEEILQTTKDEHETWADVFKRIDAVNGIDVRTLTRVVVAILEELDVQKEREKTRDIFDSTTPNYTVTTGNEAGYTTGGIAGGGTTGTNTGI